MKKAYLKIISFVLSMVLLLSLCAMGSVQAVIDFETMIKDGEIYDAMYEFLKQYPNFEGKPRFSLFKAYESYCDNQATPDWVVVEVHSTGTATKYYHELGGFYIYCYHPSYGEQILSYYVIDMKTKKITPLIDAVDASKDEYLPFFTESGYEKITRIGDINRDKNLDVKDATLIQKCLVGIETFDDYEDMVLGFTEKQHGKWERFVSDFNRDGERNVKDATAIQKHIAGLEY